MPESSLLEGSFSLTGRFVGFCRRIRRIRRLGVVGFALEERGYQPRSKVLTQANQEARQRGLPPRSLVARELLEIVQAGLRGGRERKRQGFSAEPSARQLSRPWLPDRDHPRDADETTALRCVGEFPVLSSPPLVSPCPPLPSADLRASATALSRFGNHGRPLLRADFYRPGAITTASRFNFERAPRCIRSKFVPC